MCETPKQTHAGDGYFGHTVRGRICGDFRIIEKRHSALEEIPEHEHRMPYATFVMEGEYVETVGGTASVLSKGAVLFHAGGECHANRFAERHATLINVEIPEWLDRRATATRQTVMDPSLRMVGSRIRRELYFGDDISPIVIEGIMLELTGLMMRSRSVRRGSGSVAGRADLIIGERFAEPIGLTDLALELRVDPSHLSRSFRRELGCTVGERIRSLRVEKACGMIQDGSPLIDVALATGFADQSHFTRTFRTVVGMTPGEYRRRTVL